MSERAKQLEEVAHARFRSSLAQWLAAHGGPRKAADVFQTSAANLSRWAPGPTAKRPPQSPPLWAILRLAELTDQSLSHLLGLDEDLMSPREQRDIHRILLEMREELRARSPVEPAPAGQASMVRTRARRVTR